MTADARSVMVGFKPDGWVFLAKPDATAGYHPRFNVTVWEVTHVPPKVTDEAVVRKMDAVFIVRSALVDPRIRYDELLNKSRQVRGPYPGEPAA